MGFPAVNISLVLVVFGLVTAYGYFMPKIKYRFDYDYDPQTKTWLKYHFVPMTWAEARSQCHAEGAILASPLSDLLKDTIVAYVKYKTNNYWGERTVNIFSGVHATYSRGVYTSVEGVPLLRLAVTWANGEPDNKENSESCLVMLTADNGTMADAKCDQPLPFVCYMKDYDFNVNECGTIDNGYVMEPSTGSCYKYHTKVMPWSEAFKICEAEGAYLAIINSETEAQLIKNSVLTRGEPGNFPSRYPNEVLIGYQDWGQSQNFMTIHGQSLNQAGFQKWRENQPNNLTIVETHDFGERCGSFDKNVARFNDLYCNIPFGFVCEMTPNSLR